MAIKTKLRVCEICGVKKKVAEFSIGRICNKCKGSNASTLQESTDDETYEISHTDEISQTGEISQTDKLSTLEIDLVGSSGFSEFKPTELNLTELPKTSETYHDLHTKVDLLNQRLDRMETLMLGLMELVGKINYDMEIGKIKHDDSE